MMCLFHKWGQWVQYKQSGILVPGLFAPKSVQGKEFEYTEDRQKRKCSKCGKVQDVKVKEE